MPINLADQGHFDDIVDAIAQGEVIPFIGAGINLYGRTEQENWQPGQDLPSGGELSAYLALKYKYPSADKKNLLRVSQYAAIMRGSGSLYRRLSEVFDSDYQIKYSHDFFASLPGILIPKRRRHPHQLIVTTNYDDVLESAFRKKKEPYDLVTYIAKGINRGKFRHFKFLGYEDDVDGKPAIIKHTSNLIESPNDYFDLPFTDDMVPTRTIILKIHGAVDRTIGRNKAQANQQPQDSLDSFVITEDDYISYLAQTDISRLVPVQLKAKLMSSGFLFLGYGLRDWNLRVILQRIWGEQELDYASWAIQLAPDELDDKFWGKHNVTIIKARLEEYLVELDKQLQRL
ncbi:MAG TPA: SIR2 family protein [Pyrinomonadaceae bacterium]|jgi:hypothetical protein